MSRQFLTSVRGITPRPSERDRQAFLPRELGGAGQAVRGRAAATDTAFPVTPLFQRASKVILGLVLANRSSYDIPRSEGHAKRRPCRRVHLCHGGHRGRRRHAGDHRPRTEGCGSAACNPPGTWQLGGIGGNWLAVGQPNTLNRDDRAVFRFDIRRYLTTGRVARATLRLTADPQTRGETFRLDASSRNASCSGERPRIDPGRAGQELRGQARHARGIGEEL